MKKPKYLAIVMCLLVGTLSSSTSARALTMAQCYSIREAQEAFNHGQYIWDINQATIRHGQRMVGPLQALLSDIETANSQKEVSELVAEATLGAAMLACSQQLAVNLAAAIALPDPGFAEAAAFAQAAACVTAALTIRAATQTLIDALHEQSLASADATYWTANLASLSTFDSDEHNASQAHATANQIALNQYVACMANASDAP